MAKVSDPKELPFWKRKKLDAMTREEWESLCDGCARCCLYKLEDEDTGEIYYTNVICRLLDTFRCRCTKYQERAKLMPTCLVLTPDLVKQIRWMPKTCAYRLVLEGKDLEWWHPLVSGDPNTVHQAGISVRYRTMAESDVDMDNLEDYIVDWLG
jgi:uncharacterized cysteine cluster protein YcgN (CxxCxxCC family)